jgi:hypothetical protein
MSGTHVRPALANYRDKVTELIGSGTAFNDVEDAIDGVAELSQDEKAGLWLLAFSLRDPADQQRDARAHLSSVG